MLENIILDIYNKTYDLPEGIKKNIEHKYIEVINKNYSKYLDIIYRCDGFCMYKQFYKLYSMLEIKRNINDATAEVCGNKVINRLIELGFVDCENINTSKFLYLKKPSISLIEGSYKETKKKINLAKDLKNDRFISSIMKIEYFTQHKIFLNTNIYFIHLKNITTQIHETIRKTGNKYRYAIQAIEHILNMDNYSDIKEFIDSTNEFNCKLGIIRELWTNLGYYFKKMILKKQLISLNPDFFKLYVTSEGQVLIHYIVNIVILDINHDLNYYKNKSNSLLTVFYNIANNDLYDVQSSYLSSNKTSMGRTTSHHLGYTLTLIGYDYDKLLKKAAVINENIGVNINSPLMMKCNIEFLDVSNYLKHSSQKLNSYSTHKNELIDRVIYKKLNEINDTNNRINPIEEINPIDKLANIVNNS